VTDKYSRSWALTSTIVEKVKATPQVDDLPGDELTIMVKVARILIPGKLALYVQRNDAGVSELDCLVEELAAVDLTT
jgi:hypothetical protein